MLQIILDNASADDIYEICQSLCGWQPYIDNEVVVYDVTDEHPGGIIIGSKDADKDLTVHANISKTSQDWTIEKIRKPEDIHAVTERLEKAVELLCEASVMNLKHDIEMENIRAAALGFPLLYETNLCNMNFNPCKL